MRLTSYHWRASIAGSYHEELDRVTCFNVQWSVLLESIEREIDGDVVPVAEGEPS
jgi:hypothetical protein